MLKPAKNGVAFWVGSHAEIPTVQPNSHEVCFCLLIRAAKSPFNNTVIGLLLIDVTHELIKRRN